AGDASVPASTQVLQVPVAGVLPVSDDLIPLGHVEPVVGTAFDFRTAATLQARIDRDDPQLRIAGGYDHCLVLEPDRAWAAALYSPHSGVAMRIDCDAPALQLYGGQALARQHPGLGDGLCLEPQDYPDAPNQPAFPDAILRPGRLYRRDILYRFARPGRDCAWDHVAARRERACRRPPRREPSFLPARRPRRPLFFVETASVSTIPLAIVGVGKIVRDQPLPAVAGNPDFRLVAAAS